jgi:SAM-dependent methyltransferase
LLRCGESTLVIGFTTEHYQELLAYRNEGLRKVGATFNDQIERPRARCFLPTVWHSRNAIAYPALRYGNWHFAGAGPSVVLADEAMKHRSSIKMLDVGCAAGTVREFFRMRDAARAIEYFGMDVAAPDVDFRVYPDMASVDERDFDLIFMSEVAEHMPADTFATEYLARSAVLLKSDGVAVVGVPNPLAPTMLERDITHVQHYPWFDLYALLRFFFADVEVYRTHFISSPRRLLTHPVRRLLAYFMEVDWCEGLTLLARQPKAPPI